jgi:hypothetical protein
MNLLHLEVKKAMVVNNDITMFLSDKSCPFLHSYYDEIRRRNNERVTFLLVKKHC